MSIFLGLDKFMKNAWDGHSVKAEIAKKSAQQRLQENKSAVQQNGPIRPSTHPIKAQISVKTEKAREKPAKKVVEESSDSEGEVFWKQNGTKIEDTVEMVTEDPKPKRRRREEEPETKLYMAKSTSAQSDLLRRLEKFSSVWGDSEERNYSSFRPRAREDFGSNWNGNAPSTNEDVTPKSFLSNMDKGNKRDKEEKKKKEKASGEDKKIGTKLDKKLRSEEKRLQSVNERADQLKQKQDMVKKALSGLGSKNKKIKFDDDGESAAKKSTSLFNEDSDDDMNEVTAQSFNIKKQFEGKHGEKV